MKFLQLSVLLFVLLLWVKPNEVCAQKNEKKQQFAGKPTDNLKSNPKTWELIFADEFDTTGNIDHSKWTYCPRAGSPWSKFLTATPNYAFVNGHSLVLKMDNNVINGDNVPYHSGGIQTSTKFSFAYGKVEVRAKFKQGQGSWPAIWMMPEKPISYGNWPNSGEIDIMEHVNNESIIHHTIHNGKVTDSDGGSSATHRSAFGGTDFNTYGIIWTPTSIQFFVNEILEYTYEKAENATFHDWPFNKPFYLILNQSGGAGWPGPIANTDLPFVMEVDWVRVYKHVELKPNTAF
jgi:beta-glucanase (GH16 family)